MSLLREDGPLHQTLSYRLSKEQNGRINKPNYQKYRRGNSNSQTNSIISEKMLAKLAIKMINNASASNRTPMEDENNINITLINKANSR